MTNEPTKAEASLAVVQETVAMSPQQSLADAKMLIKMLDDAKKKLLTEGEHIIQIQGRPYINRQGWRLLAIPANVDIAVRNATFEVVKDAVVAKVDCVASIPRPDGTFREVSGTGCADTNEDFYRRGRLVQWGGSEDQPKGYDEIYFMSVFKGYGKNTQKIGAAWFIPKGYGALMALAETRAKNRALSDMFGGAPTAEEVEAETMTEEQVLEARRDAVRERMLATYPLEEARKKLEEISGKGSTNELTDEDLLKMEEHLGLEVRL